MTITMWSRDAVPALQGCFQCRDWQVFTEARVCEVNVDLADYASDVLGCIQKCAEDVTTTRTVTCYLNLNTSLSARLTPPPGERPLSVNPAEVRRALQRVYPLKAAGPNISGWVLRGCTHQLTEVLTDIFITSPTGGGPHLPKDSHDHPHPQNVHSDKHE